MTKASDNVFPKIIVSEEAAPATPASGTVVVYAKADGLLYSKDDVGTETLVSGGAGGGGGAGGAGEGSPFVSGGTVHYVLPGVMIKSLGALNLGTTGRIYTPLIVQESLTVTGLVTEITSGNAGGRLTRLGLYEADFNWQPGALLAEGEVDCSTTGIKVVTVSETLAAGRYLLAAQGNNTGLAFRLARVIYPVWAQLGANGILNSLSVATAYGAMPDPGLDWTTSSQDGASDPFVIAFLRVSA
jgi:hypothetical protein